MWGPTPTPALLSAARPRYNPAAHVKHLKQSAWWRRVFLAACLPYLLLSVSVELVHLDRVDRDVPRVLHGVHATAAVPTLHSEPIPAPEYSCAACTWLRAQPRPHTLVIVGAGPETRLSDILPRHLMWVATRTPQPSPLRGPPVRLA